jgi:hypothetical protein
MVDWMQLAAFPTVAFSPQNGPLLSTFPMFVPSLSWLNGHFYYDMAWEKKAFFAPSSTGSITPAVSSSRYGSLNRVTLPLAPAQRRTHRAETSAIAPEAKR